MKIRQRLTLTLSFAVSIILIILSVIVYFFSKAFHENEFYGQLERRLFLTEKYFLERDKLSTGDSRSILEDFLQKLPNEQEWVVQSIDALPAHLQKHLTQDISQYKTGNYFHFKEKDNHGVAAKYHIDGHTHFVVVTAQDVFGQSKLRNLIRIMWTTIPIAILLIALIVWRMTSNALHPLEENIDHALQITASKMSARLKLPKQRDEIYDFVFIFNDLLSRLEKSFNAQKAFISNASHEIRNPLTVISGEAEVALASTRDIASYQASLKTILKAADRLNELTNHLLSIARMTEESKIISPEKISITRLFQGIKKEFQLTSDNKQIKWPDMIKDYDQIFIEGSLLLLQSAFRNIIDNALKYSDDKPIGISLTVGSNRVQISITDQGMGIPEEELPFITAPLYRAKNARRFPGHGIGLPLVESIISIHGGSMDIVSQIDTGTTVTVQLPKYNPLANS